MMHDERKTLYREKMVKAMLRMFGLYKRRRMKNYKYETYK